ncbi:MAG TPA: hypothetical protein VH143_00005, partial [Kofleriaceae bacterium]|nr:hypothetical protein [Kofleriaceae bacterium]
MRKLAIVLLLMAACTKKQDQCETNADCTDPAYPFCDVDGSFPASGGDKDVCTIMPTDCPVDVCGCTAGAATCGSDGTLTVCNDDGMSVTTTMCATGCELPAATCKTIVPSNGLGSALGIASTAPDITLSSGTTIDTDTGAVTDDTGTAISLTSIIVQQPSTEDASDIRVFIGHSFTIGSTTVTGANALAFVSDGAIEIAGSLTAVASNFQAGPGAQTDSEAACAGFSALRSSGGGGNDTAGGSGGGIREGAQGGDAVSGFALIGGCEGGPINFGSAANPQVADGGAGGGAIQLVSSTSITLGGVINVGGG